MKMIPSLVIDDHKFIKTTENRKESFLSSVEEQVKGMKACSVRLERCDTILSKVQQNDGNDNGGKISVQLRKRKRTNVDELNLSGKSKKKKQGINSHSTLEAIALSMEEIPSKYQRHRGEYEITAVGAEERNYGGQKEETNNGKSMNKNGSKLQKCDLCEFSTKFKYDMIRHRYTHTGENPFKCEKCARGFTQKSALKKHMRTHANEFPFQCSICRQGFEVEEEKNAHGKSCNCKRYQCDLCKYYTLHKSNFVNHMRTHTGEKPFKCEKCAEGFTQKGSLKMHMRTHANEFPFQCSICRRRFHVEEAKNSHEKLCNCKTFQCDLCKYCTLWKPNLIRHMRTHTGKKPFVRLRCSESFALNSNLNQHIKRCNDKKGVIIRRSQKPSSQLNRKQLQNVDEANSGMENDRTSFDDHQTRISLGEAEIVSTSKVNETSLASELNNTIVSRPSIDTQLVCPFPMVQDNASAWDDLSTQDQSREFYTRFYTFEPFVSSFFDKNVDLSIGDGAFVDGICIGDGISAAEMFGGSDPIEMESNDISNSPFHGFDDTELDKAIDANNEMSANSNVESTDKEHIFCSETASTQVIVTSEIDKINLINNECNGKNGVIIRRSQKPSSQLNRKRMRNADEANSEMDNDRTNFDDHETQILGEPECVSTSNINELSSSPEVSNTIESNRNNETQFLCALSMIQDNASTRDYLWTEDQAREFQTFEPSVVSLLDDSLIKIALVDESLSICDNIDLDEIIDAISADKEHILPSKTASALQTGSNTVENPVLSMETARIQHCIELHPKLERSKNRDKVQIISDERVQIPKNEMRSILRGIDKTISVNAILSQQ